MISDWKESTSEFDFDWMDEYFDKLEESKQAFKDAIDFAREYSEENSDIGLEDQAKQTLDNMKQNHTNWLQNLLEINANNLDESRKLQIQMIKENMEEELKAADLTAEQRIAIEDKAATAIKEINREAFTAKLGMAASALSGMSELLGEETKLGKGVAAAEIGIETIQSAFEIGATASKYYADGNIPMGILATAQAAGVVASGAAAIRDVYAVDDDTSTDTSTITESYHTGVAPSASTKAEEREITATLLNTERVLSPAQSSVFDNIISTMQGYGGGDLISSNVAGVENSYGMMKTAMSAAVSEMQTPVVRWRDYVKEKDKQTKISNNRKIK